MSSASPTAPPYALISPPAPSLTPAVVAGDDGDDVPHVAAQQHLEHGDARGAARFPVVARLLDGGVGADDVREAVVGGVGVLLADARR